MSRVPKAPAGGGPVSKAIKFAVDAENAPGYDSWRSFNLRQSLETLMKAKIQVPGFTLGAPSVRDRFGVVGTDNPDSLTNFLLQFDVEAMMESMRANPIKSFLRMKEHVSFVQWATPQNLVCATGSGRIALINVREDRSMEIVGDANGVHTDIIREITFMPNNGNIFASGGFDKRLCLVDLSRRHILQKLDTTQVVGSVKWDPFNEACIAATVDNGKFYLFDVRTSWQRPTLSIGLGLAELYTHERISPHELLLGFGSGRLSHVDIRMRSELSRVTDPYVDVIGSIHYNRKSHALCIGGIRDISVWKHDTSTSTIKFWSHSLTGTRRRVGKDLYTSSVAWLADDIVMSTDSNGHASMYVQGWQIPDFDRFQ